LDAQLLGETVPTYGQELCPFHHHLGRLGLETATLIATVNATCYEDAHDHHLLATI